MIFQTLWKLKVSPGCNENGNGTRRKLFIRNSKTRFISIKISKISFLMIEISRRKLIRKKLKRMI